MPYSSIPVMCIKCGLELVPDTNGVMVLELWNKNTQVYKIWDADLVKCPGCGIQMVKGFAMNPFAIHHDENFSKVLLDIEEQRKSGKKKVFELKEICYALHGGGR